MSVDAYALASCLLDPDGGFARNHLNRPLLGVLGVYLNDGQLRVARGQRLNHDTDQRS